MLMIVVVLCANIVTALPSLIVETKCGKVSGWERHSRDGRLYQAWTAIRYAKPPLGKLRFKAPKPPEKWSGIYDATKDMPMCLAFTGQQTIEGVEDCLHLSVYRPKISTKKLPVLFYLYGGAFRLGSNGPNDNADFLMDEDVVLVEINHRVNIFGFGTLGDADMPGNAGLKDAVMALRWVKQNIEAFKGDTNSVTVFGGSSGAQLAHLLLNSKVAAREDLFHRVMSDSGAINHISMFMKNGYVRSNTLRVAKIVRCSKKTSKQILSCMQSANASVLMEAVAKIFPEDISKISWAPVIEVPNDDDMVVPEDLSLTPSKKPWITRFSNGEYIVYKLLSGDLREWFKKNVMCNLTGYLESRIREHWNDENQIKKGAAIFEKFYFPVKQPVENVTLEFCHMFGEGGFVFPAIFNIMRHQGPKWLGIYEYVPYNKTAPHGELVLVSEAAEHGMENCLYFNKVPTPTTCGDLALLPNYRASKRLIKYLVNFAYYNNPTPPGSPIVWPQFQGSELFRFTNDGDFMADQRMWRRFSRIYDVWYSAMGWR